MAQLAESQAPALIRAATLFDAGAISRLIEPFARADQMLPRPVADIIENLRDYKVAFDGDELVGVAALHLMPPDTAEVRALAVADAWQGRGLGRELVQRCLDEARSLGIRQAFTLTLQPGFFERLGFTVSERDSLTHKVWTECYKCPKYDRCDEIALTVDL
jgi:amino-acid N-acetyltransferase